ncbi:MAG: hypothetical protein J0I66_10370 [Microbacterium sp.]|nr:hypothetical protein [Microbacterium sp.]
MHEVFIKRVSEYRMRFQAGEDISDKVLDGAADLAKKVAPDQFDGPVDDIRGNIDKAVGTE